MNFLKFTKQFNQLSSEIELRTEKFYLLCVAGRSAELERKVILRRIPVMRLKLDQLEKELRGE